MERGTNNTKFEQFTARFSDTGIDALKIGRNYFLAEDRLKKLKEGVNRDPFSLGLFLGEERGEFHPSPAMIDVISRLPDSENRKIFVNGKAEWLFLCGRNILEDSIIKNPRNIKDGPVLIQNEKGENLGYGMFMKQGRDLVIKNFLDKGKYLRMNERKRR